MNRLITFVLVISLIIYASCGDSSKGFNSMQNGAIPDSLYPSADLIIPTHSDWTKGHYPEKIKEFKTTPLQNRDIVFLGNSITEYGGDWGKRFENNKVKNRGISGDVTDGVLKRLGEIYYTKPRSVFILIGINDIFNDTLTVDYIADNIIKIATTIRKKSPATKVYVQTILPTSYQKIVSKIKLVNEKIRSNQGSKTYSVIELHAAFADENDLIKPGLTKDGVHLTEEGYVLWVSILKKYKKL